MHSAVIPLDRDPETGQFVRGNSASAGIAHPAAARAAQLRRAMQEAVTTEDIHAIFRAMIDEAKAGNVFAANFVVDRVIGKPAPMTPEQQDDVAERICRQWEEWGERAEDEATERETPKLSE